MVLELNNFADVTFVVGRIVEIFWALAHPIFYARRRVSEFQTLWDAFAVALQ